MYVVFIFRKKEKKNIKLKKKKTFKKKAARCYKEQKVNIRKIYKKIKSKRECF